MIITRSSILKISLAVILVLVPVEAWGLQGIPLAVPGTPINLSIARIAQPTPDVSSDTIVSWQGAVSGGVLVDGSSPITGYVATAMSGTNFDVPTAASCAVPPNNAVPTYPFTCTLTGLGYGKTYKVQVVANNVVGSSPPAVSASFTTPSLNQAVTISGTPAGKVFGDPDFPLTALASSGQPITWSTTTPTICTVGITGVIHLLGVGTCSITAFQNATGSHYADASASVLFSIVGVPTATATGATNIQGNSAKLNALIPYPGAVVTPTFCISITNSNTSCVMPAGVTMGVSSPSTVTASSANAVSAVVSGLQGGTTYYYWVQVVAGGLSAKSSTASFQTPAVPVLTLSGSSGSSGSSSSILGTVGLQMSLTISATSGSGVYSSWVASSLPTGLIFAQGATSATISGIPTQAGSYASQVSITDDLGVTTTLPLNFIISTVVTTPKPQPSPISTPTILEVRIEGSFPVAIPLPNVYPTSAVVIADGNPKLVRGVADATVLNGVLEITPLTAFSGKILLPVTITTNGFSIVQTILLTVAPASVTVPVQILSNAAATTIRWAPSRNAIGYQVLVNGKLSCTSTSPSCLLRQPLGPKSKVEVLAVGGDATVSISKLAVYATKKLVEVASVNFAANSVTIDSQAKKKLLLFVALVKAEGFTSITIVGHADGQSGSKGSTALSTARAKATLKFLGNYLKVSMKVVAQGSKEPVASDKTKEGQAANRRASLLVK